MYLLYFLTLWSCFYITALCAQDSDNKGFTILNKTEFKRTLSVFPQSKTNNEINSLFKKNTFDAQKVFKQNKDIAFQPKATEKYGANNTFKQKPKPVNEADIPKELLKILKK